jgi:hypothetical protein
MVMSHLHSRDIGPHPRSLELVLLPLRQRVIDGILQLAVMRAVPCGDSLPCSINYNIATRCSESWTHMPPDHIGPIEDLHECPQLFPP